MTALNQRFASGVIYTYIGEILIAMNPYKDMPLYNQEYAAKYALGGEPSKRPHVFATALSCFKSMAHTGIDQSCVISGDSGAGKDRDCKVLYQAPPRSQQGRAPKYPEQL